MWTELQPEDEATVATWDRKDRKAKADIILRDRPH